MSREKVGHYTSIKPEKVKEDMATNTWIRVLIRIGDGAPTFAMRLFTVEKGGHIFAHKHPWEHEIFVLRGKGEIRISDRSYHVKEGYFIFIPPNVEHEYWNRGEGDLEFLCMIPHEPTAPEE
jgi:quercetin dioxygenase-like cupin family protein